jgi:hypothetical protein
LEIGNKKPYIFVLTLIIIIAATMPCFPRVSADNFTPIYGGEGKPLSDEWSPTISLKLPNGTSIYFYSDKNLSLQDNEPLNLSLSVSAGKSPNGRAVGLFDVSYNASWLQHPVVLYHWNGNPADFGELFSVGPYFLDSNLTLNNIPKGNHSIEFKVTSIGMYIGIPYFGSFKKEETMTLNLSIGNPLPTPTPTATPPATPSLTPIVEAILIASLIIVVVVVAGLLVYFKKRKH